MSVSSKLSRYNDMLGNEKQIRILGNGIGLIIAFLAVLNYINMMTLGVHNRRKEFATLKSIGMTTKNIQRVLMKEGIGYALVSITLSLMIGVPISWFVYQSMNTYQIEYTIPVIPNLILFAGITVICFTVPIIIFRFSNRGSILEKLRDDLD